MKKTDTVVVELSPFDRRRLEDLAGYYRSLDPVRVKAPRPSRAHVLRPALAAHHRSRIQFERRVFVCKSPPAARGGRAAHPLLAGAARGASGASRPVGAGRIAVGASWRAAAGRSPASP